ncbi:MAG: DUF4388 domain-containing protein [Acidobacteriota bacterium]
MQGHLKETMLPEVYRKILGAKLSGKLRVTSGPIEKCVFFKHGGIVYATSNQPGDRLGEILVERGKITPHEKETAVNLPMPGKRIGETLVDMGKLQPSDVTDGLSRQVVRIVKSTFLLQEGNFYFSEDARPQQEVRVNELSTSDVIMDGIRTMVYKEEMRASLGNPMRPLKLTADAYRIAEQVTLKPTEGFVLSRIDGIAALSEISSLVPAEEIDTYKMLYGLRVLGFLVENPQRDKAADALKETEGQPAAKSRPSSSGDPDLDVAVADLEGIYSKLSIINHHQLLGVPSNAPTNEVKKAYYRLAKTYHPDRYQAAEDKEIQRKAAAVFAKMTEAYEALLDARTRTAHDVRAKAAEAGSKESTMAERRDEKVAETESTDKSAAESYKKGIDLYNARKYAEAIEPLSQAVKQAPKNLEYVLALGRAQAKNPTTKKDAEKTFLRAVNIDKLNPLPYVEMGKYYKEIKMFEKAEALLQRALAMDDEHEEAQKELASLPGHGAEKKSLWSRLTGR